MQWQRLFILAGLMFTGSGVAMAAADEPSAEQRLAGKGLRRLSTFYALKGETEVTGKMRALDATRQRTLEAQEAAERARAVVDAKEETMRAYIQKRLELRRQVNLVRSVDQHNQIVTAMNELGDRILLMHESKTEEELEKARAAAGSAVEKYVEELFEARRLYDAVQAEYEALSADAEVTAAIEEYSKTSGRTFRLGPNTSFLAAGRKLGQYEKTVLTDTIKLRRGPGGLWYVTATFNGKASQEIAIDTGASLIALSWTAAESLGLTPTKDSPTLLVSVADGRQLEAKQVMADTVRVGKFTATDVRCGVMPPEASNAPLLLGLSFFSNFNFKIDSAKGELIMSQIGGSDTEEPDDKSSGRRTPVRQTPSPKTGGPDESPERTRQLLQLLTPKDGGSGESSTVEISVGSGAPVAFRPSVRGPVKTLEERFGRPTQLRPHLFRRQAADGSEERLSWKLFSWGPVKVLADETGTARYFTVVE